MGYRRSLKSLKSSTESTFFLNFIILDTTLVVTRRDENTILEMEKKGKVFKESLNRTSAALIKGVHYAVMFLSIPLNC